MCVVLLWVYLWHVPTMRGKAPEAAETLWPIILKPTIQLFLYETVVTGMLKLMPDHSGQQKNVLGHWFWAPMPSRPITLWDFRFYSWLRLEMNGFSFTTGLNRFLSEKISCFQVILKEFYSLHENISILPLCLMNPVIFTAAFCIMIGYIHPDV